MPTGAVVLQEEEEDWQVWEEGSEEKEGGEVGVSAPTTWPSLALSGWRRVLVHASKPHFQVTNWSSHSLQYQYCQSICTPNPLLQCVGQREKLSPQVCPGYCPAPPPARAAALLQPAHSTPHCPLNSTLPTPSFSSAGRFSHRPTLPGPPEASIVVGQI